MWFAPYNQNNVGVFDVATNAFTTVATAGRMLYALSVIQSFNHSLTRLCVRSIE